MRFTGRTKVGAHQAESLRRTHVSRRLVLTLIPLFVSFRVLFHRPLLLLPPPPVRLPPPRRLRVTRVLDHAQMSFADVPPLRVHMYPPRDACTLVRRVTRVPCTCNARRCDTCACVRGAFALRYVREEDDDHTTTSTSTSATRLFPWLP